LANETDATVAQTKHLWQTVDRPNLMIKIPATEAGIPAIRQAIAAGININVTLIFSIERYRSVMDAYLSGLDDRLAAGTAIENIHSVASFFISRIDSRIDPKLPANSQLLGKIAIANAKLAYQEFLAVIHSPRFKALKGSKANVQRPLWASTSVKNPNYSDTLYVDNLIGPQTVNTVPPETLDVFRDHGTAELTISVHVEKARREMVELEKLGIQMKTIAAELEADGVKSFADAFTMLLQTIEKRRHTLAV
jgi:transaldolase